MERKPFTLRLEQDTHAALAHLSEELHRPMNQLVQEALEEYLDRTSRQVERQLEERLERLRNWRQGDPGFEHAIDAVADAEVASEDPAEGKVVDGNGDLRSGLRELLDD